MIIFDLLAQARRRALLSRKPNTKVGAILVDQENNVLLEASNDYIQPLYDDESIESIVDRKFYSEHAERRLIYSAIRSGIHDFHDKTLIITHFPCCDCARAIVLVGINKIIVDDNYMNTNFFQKWEANFNISKRMLTYNKVDIKFKGMLNDSLKDG